ncbi:MAG: NAD(P)H-dependent oxidoreductase [Candidatus Aminicenantes bacterium]|nr:NAD(P)H-dependent oxidoreductase [Candidatus Aminicenantes bacterium]NLH75636.1 hypothetical protein [Acidobacteriota bacterium]
MDIMTVIAHPNPKSFCHALLEEFDAGLREAGQMNFPAILKGWFERVFSPGFAYSLTPEGWRGESAGRIPLFRHEKALVINTTHFKEETYQGDFGKAMARIIDDWGLRYPGVKKVEHAYFYGADVSTPGQCRDWLAQARRLGREFAA